MISWSGKAMYAMRNALEKQNLGSAENELFQLYTLLLHKAFPDQTVFVRDRQGGYDEQKLQHALFVEVFEPVSWKTNHSDPGNNDQEHTTIQNPVPALRGGRLEVVKIGLKKQIEQELNGWKAICPVGRFSQQLKDHITLLTLRDPQVELVDSAGRQWRAVVYQDAQSQIGQFDLVSLEAATLEACRANVPETGSVIDCLIDVFHKLGEHLYSGSRLERPSDFSPRLRINGLFNPPHSQAAELEEMPSGRWAEGLKQCRLNERIGQWSALRERREMIKQLNARLQLTYGLGSLLRPPLPPRNPVDCVQAILALPLVEGGEELLTHLIPPLVRARTHGDLHGRNIEVAWIGNKANFPVVFDYEHAGAHKLVAWDFVKLEYELKVRAIDAALGSLPESEFLTQVTNFEDSLWLESSRLRGQEETRYPSEPATPLDRIRCVVLALRQLAFEALGLSFCREDWHEEYRFISMLYAVTSVNYGYTGRERQAALISGAVAAGGSTWLAELYAWDFARWRDRHEAFQNSEQPLDYDDIVTWEAPYSVAKDLISAKVAQADQPNEHLHAAVGLLHRIIARYPHVSPPREELLLALLELDDAKEFERQKELAEKHIAKTHEYWCRLGRKEKEIGFAQLERGNLSLAISRLQQGEEFYSNGMELTADPYPLINVAAVCLYLAAAYHLDHQPEGSAEALKRSHDYGQQAMRILISSVSRPTTNSEAHFWSLATRAEAMLLAGQNEESARLYRQLPEHPACTPRNLETAERQKRKNEDAILMLSRSME